MCVYCLWFCDSGSDSFWSDCAVFDETGLLMYIKNNFCLNGAGSCNINRLDVRNGFVPCGFNAYLPSTCVIVSTCNCMMRTLITYGGSGGAVKGLLALDVDIGAIWSLQLNIKSGYTALLATALLAHCL